MRAYTVDFSDFPDTERENSTVNHLSELNAEAVKG